MPKVTLRVFGALATVLGQKEAEIEGSLLKDAIESLSKEFGDKFKTKIIDDEGNLRRHIRVYINGKDVRFLKQLDSPLKVGDKVLILPAVVGG